MPFDMPTDGRVSFIRLIRSDLSLEIFWSAFSDPTEATHEYVRATIDVAAKTMTVVLHDEITRRIPTHSASPGE